MAEGASQPPTAAEADLAEQLTEAVAQSAASRRTISIVGHGSKPAPGEPRGDRLLDVTGHSGVTDYRPQELVITARAGTPLAELERVLAREGQMLPFDPPRFGGRGTLGGAIATGLAGPARPWRGSVRDAVLGVEIVNGLGERLQFGGSVIKNVAGYDVSRLVTGAHGTLGVILSVSLKLLPLPEADLTLTSACDAARAGRLLGAWSRWPLPITATCFVGGELRVRVSGSRAGVDAAAAELGLPEREPDNTFWQRVRDHRHAYFAGWEPLMRLTLPRGAALARDDAMIEWNGCQAWLRGEVDDIPEGGFLTRFRPAASPAAPEPTIGRYMRRIKHAFDPHGILNPGSIASLEDGA